MNMWTRSLYQNTAAYMEIHKRIAEILQEINANDARQFLIIFNGVQRIYSRITSFYSH